MFNKSLHKIALVSGGNILNAILGFAFLSATAKVLDLNTFGKYALITTLLTTISKISDFGTNSVYVADTLNGDENKIRNAFYTFRILLTIVSIPLGVACLWAFGLTSPGLILIFVLGLIFYSLNYTLYALFQKQEKFVSLVFLNTLPAIIKGAFALMVFLNLLQLDLGLAFGVFSISIASSLLLIFFIPKNLLAFKFETQVIKELFKSSAPAGVSQFITEAWPAINNAAAKIAKGFEDVGVFSLASKISNIFSLLSLSIFAVLLPKNAKRKKENLGYDITETAIISVGVIILAFVAIFVSEVFLSKMFGDKFADSNKILDILIFASALSSIQAFMENYFFVEDKTHLLMYVNLVKLGGFIMLAIILTSIFSVIGLAWSNFISAGVSLILVFAFITKNSVR